jgi:UDP-glucose 4-epimerase
MEIQFYEGKRLLITGGAGYVASNLISLLREIECFITRFDRPTTRFAPVIGKASIQDIQGDIRDRAIWEPLLEDADIVFHFAAQTSVYVADENPIADLDVNVLPILYLLETCRQKGLQPTVIFAGTVTECGIPTLLPVDENHPDHPITIYDLHKLMAESYLKHYTAQEIVHGTVLRLANVYGPGPKSSSADRGVLNLMIQKALKGETLTVYGDGNYMRDYVYVEDVAHAFLKAGAKIESVNGRHFVIASGQGHTIVEAINLVADRVALKTGQRVPVIHVVPPTPQSPIEGRNFVADSSKFARATGWQTSYLLPAGIDRTIETFLESSDMLVGGLKR